MRLLYLGTGSAGGYPGVFCRCAACKKALQEGGRNIRHRSSVLVNTDLLVDFAPDNYARSIELGLALGEVDHLVVTHAHTDHLYAEELKNLCSPHSLGEHRLNLYASGEVLRILGEKLTPEGLKKLDGRLILHELKPFEEKTLGDYTIVPLAARHCAGAFIYLISDGQKTVLYGNDTGFFPEETWDYLDGRHIDLASLDCNNLMGADVPEHMTLEDATTVKKRLFQIGSADHRTKFIATHFSHESGMLHREIEERFLIYGITAAYDGMEVKM